jgi:hypothetical protein
MFFQKAQFNIEDVSLGKIFQMLVDYEKQHINELRETIDHEKDVVDNSATEEVREYQDDVDEQRFFPAACQSHKWRSQADER